MEKCIPTFVKESVETFEYIINERNIFGDFRIKFCKIPFKNISARIT